MADVKFTSLVTSLITCHHCVAVSFTVALVICKLQRTYMTSGAASVYFDDGDNATCKSRVGLPYSVLPVAERTICGFGCERTRGSWIHACNTTMQYAFVLHCCAVMVLRTASPISNKHIDLFLQRLCYRRLFCSGVVSCTRASSGQLDRNQCRHSCQRFVSSWSEVTDWT